MKITSIVSLILLSSSVALAEEKAEAIKQGKATFMTCAACHGQDGKGTPAGPDKLMAPAYKGSKIVDGDPELFALILLKGIKKEGNDYLGMMMPLSALDDKALAGVMTYVRNEYSEKKDLVTSQQVAAWREKYKDRTEQVTREEITTFLKKSEEAAAEKE